MRVLKFHSTIGLLAATLAGVAAGCARGTPDARETTASAARQHRVAGDAYVVRDTTIAATLEVSGVAAPIQQATMSTKLMGAVTAVLVKEGDAVLPGQPLVRIDARDLTAKAGQASASVAEAEAVHRDATVQANRIRALYTDSAATRAQLDAAEIGLARAEAALRTARAAAEELGAVAEYSVIRAPFAGVVTKRFVDPGAFASPGTPLVSIQDVSRLRLTGSTTPDATRALRRGQTIDALVEGRPVRATIEGIVPADAGNLYTINAVVANSTPPMLGGSTATLLVPAGARSMIVVPASAIVREGDLTGVKIRGRASDDVRWVRLGRTVGGFVEVNAGLRAGDTVIVPTPATHVAARN